MAKYFHRVAVRKFVFVLFSWNIQLDGQNCSFVSRKERFYVLQLFEQSVERSFFSWARSYLRSFEFSKKRARFYLRSFGFSKIWARSDLRSLHFSKKLIWLIYPYFKKMSQIRSPIAKKVSQKWARSRSEPDHFLINEQIDNFQPKKLTIWHFLEILW